MLLKHIYQYTLSLGLPAIVNMLSIVIFTRLLDPASYGEYAIVIAMMGLGNAVLFRWISLGLLRFYSAEKDRYEVFLSTLLFGFFCAIALTGLCALSAFPFLTPGRTRDLLFISTALLWAHAFFELNRELVRSQFNPRMYGFMGLIKALISLAVGGFLAYLGFGAEGLITGLLCGLFLSVVPMIRKEWMVARFRSVNKKLSRELMLYGLPLSVTFALAFVVGSSDRILLAWLLDTEAAGLYSVGYDLARNILGIPMMIVNLAAFPLAVKDLEQHGNAAASRQLNDNATLLFAISIPSAAGLVVLAPNIINLLIGEEFRVSTVEIFPLITLGALLAGIKAYYFDLSFQMARKTYYQIWITLVCALINVVLNILWIPKIGYMAAAYSTVITYVVGLSLSWYLGRSVFRMPIPFYDFFKVVIATSGMVVILVTVKEFRGLLALSLQVPLGVVVCTGLLYLLNFMHMRKRLNDYFTSKN